MVFIVISILLLVPYAGLLLFYRRSWLTIPEFQVPSGMETDHPFVSVIISARNEELRIGKCLDSMVQQNYPNDRFEVLVIDDHSEDNTSAVVSSFSEKYGFIKLITLAEFVPGTTLNSYKKKAIETGIGLARGELIMTTDADCVVSPNWILTVSGYFGHHHSAMIASPVKIDLPAGRNLFQKLLAVFQILDFSTLQGITGAALYKKFHYMANGANLAYPKSIFVEVEGFKNADELASGDDMFLMEKVREVRPHKIHYLKSIDATVVTKPEPTIGSFVNQRIRWASKSATYQDYKIKSVLALVYLVNVWVLILLLASVFGHLWMHLVIFLALKISIELIFLIPVSRFFHQQKSLTWFVPLQPAHIFYIIITGWLGKFGTYRWKGRKVK